MQSFHIKRIHHMKSLGVSWLVPITEICFWLTLVAWNYLLSALSEWIASKENPEKAYREPLSYGKEIQAMQCGPKPAASASLGNLWVMQIPRPHPGFLNQKCLGVGTDFCVLTSPPRDSCDPQECPGLRMGFQVRSTLGNNPEDERGFAILESSLLMQLCSVK